MTQTFEAVYEDGVFKPLATPVGLTNHARVTIQISTRSQAGRPRDVIGTMPREDAEEMLAIIEREFGYVDPDGCK